MTNVAASFLFILHKTVLQQKWFVFHKNREFLVESLARVT
ncbi:hypothetical protein D920_01550 [Enterococcus faecalis 13-SD-W-01]|nr:hypothetical protein D920_01550 [Enterococcus faecalis 13-SD-W-01]